MADRELRHMRRTELVEIIFALKQSEDQLKAENADLTAKLEQRQIHLDSAGSIAQAALELNHVFEAAQAAADDYLASVRSVDRDALQAQAKAEADQILAQARAEAEQLSTSVPRQRPTVPPCGPKRNRRSQHGGLLLSRAPVSCCAAAVTPISCRKKAR